MQAIDASENVDFNLHTHVECNSPLLPDSKTIVISTHVECDHIGLMSRMHFKSFQLTHSRGVRRICVWNNCLPGRFQLTHSRGVRQRICLGNYHAFGISTHALTWSATTFSVTGTTIFIFQLTHSRGVRHSLKKSIMGQLHFNSRTHVECDCNTCVLLNVNFISTHALTWSATI